MLQEYKSYSDVKTLDDARRFVATVVESMADIADTKTVATATRDAAYAEFASTVYAGEVADPSADVMKEFDVNMGASLVVIAANEIL